MQCLYMQKSLSRISSNGCPNGGGIQSTGVKLKQINLIIVRKRTDPSTTINDTNCEKQAGAGYNNALK